MGENGEIMKKVFFSIIAIILLGGLLTACSSEKPTSSRSFGNIDFVVESNPDYLGSYTIERCNPAHPTYCWTEWGEWSTGFELLFDMNKRICVGNKSGVFRARSDYHWVADKNCLILEKRK